MKEELLEEPVLGVNHSMQVDGRVPALSHDESDLPVSGTVVVRRRLMKQGCARCGCSNSRLLGGSAVAKKKAAKKKVAKKVAKKPAKKAAKKAKK